MLSYSLPVFVEEGQGECLVEVVRVVSRWLWVPGVVGGLDSGDSWLTVDWLAVDDLSWDVLVLEVLHAAIWVLDVGTWDVLVVVGAVLGLVGLSWNEGVIVEVSVDSELWVVVLELLSLSVAVVGKRLVVGDVSISVNDWDEVVVPCWLDVTDLGMRVWVEVSVVEVDPVNVIVGEVIVVASVGAEVVIDVVVIVLVGVAFWVGLDLSEVAELWGLILGWGDVLDLSVEKRWVGNFVGVWLWVWVVDLGDGPLVLSARVGLWLIVVIVADVVVALVGIILAVIVDLHGMLLLLWNWEWVPEGLGGGAELVVEVAVEVDWNTVLLDAEVGIVEGVVVVVTVEWLDSVLVVGTVVLEGAIVFAAVLHADLVVEVG